MSEEQRHELAKRMVTVLPKFGFWADGIREFETPYGKVGLRQLTILWSLRHQEDPTAPMSPSAFTESYHVQPSVITKALAKLEAGGFIHRAIDPRDSRRFLITSTEKGRLVSVFVEDRFIREMVGSIDDASDDQLDELCRTVELLDRVVERLETRRRETLTPRVRPKRSEP